ncbi:MAG: Ig domain-containing protein, partial [Gemmatimonadetes bacterium]|nr:Ig domain-containing protein [Gemmatimonadota bacterium]
MTTPISSERNIAVSSRSSRLSKQISSTRVRVASACRGGRRRLVLTVFVAICLPLLAVCGKDSPTQPEPSAPPPAPPPTPVPTRTDVTPSSATLNAIGQTLQLAVQVFDQNNAVMNGASVVWSSSDASVATVSGQGLVTAVSNGSATITAHSGTVSASVPVTVMQSAGSIAIEPAMAVLMSLGETVQLSATVLDGNGQPVAGAVVTWSSSDVSVATVSAQGLVTAVSNGSATVTARSGSVSTSVPVSVMQSAGSIVIEPSSATLMSLGETVQVSASVLDGNGQAVAGAAVEWSSSDASVATVSAQGLVTALANGSVTVTARSGSASTSIPVTVMQSAGSIVIEPSEATLMSLGETVQLSATVLDGNGQPVAGATVVWASSDASVATVSAQGLVTAVANSSVTVTARSGSASASVPVTVMQSAGSIAIEPAMAVLMSLGETVQLSASVLDGNGQPVAGAVVTWSSSDASVATVSAQGLVTAVANGSATITARSGSASSSIPVSVMQSAGSIEIEPSSATLMALGEMLQLSASVFDGNGQPVAGAAVVWSSSDASVATVSGQGLVTAVGNGSATVTARSGSASASIPVSVMQSAGSIVIEPSSATLMALGETVQLSASVLDGNGQPVAGTVVEWSSSDEAVATVNAQGLVTAVANGNAQVTAHSGGVSASIPVTVMQSAGSIVIEPSLATLMALGETVQLSATVLDGNGQP